MTHLADILARQRAAFMRDGAPDLARMQAHPAWRKWQAAAEAEPWIVPEDEV